MTTTENKLQVANTIAAQIGRRAFQMMGTNTLLGSGNALIFNVKGCPTVNKIQIALTPDDLYTVTFYKVRGMNCRQIAECEGVYAESLHAVIESQTGLYLSL